MAPRPLTLLLPLLLACGESDGTDATSGDAPTSGTRLSDVDGDGVTTGEGDCDDLDPEVHPRVEDTCNGRDDDCDDAVDEDFDGDGYEPNDKTGVDLGWMEEEEDWLLFGYLHPDGDVDRYRVRVEDDDFTWFSLEAWLYGVPADADYALELRWVEDPDGDNRGVVASADEEGLGGYEDVDWGGEPGEDDGGVYEIVVTSTEGSGCASPYTIELILGQW